MHKNTSSEKVSCAIVGARGYSGLELARLLLRHPKAELTNCFATSEFRLTDHLNSPASAQVKCFPDSEIFNHLAEIVFLATPAEVSLKLAPKLVSAGCKVIDLSGAFRLKKNDYLKWYGFQHDDQTSLAQARYGLSPFIGPSLGESLVANPGCYATAISLALIPLLKNSLIKEDTLVIDAKSGTTGAGKKATENLIYSEVEGECLPYKVGQHQHYPEIQEAVEAFSGKKIEAHMTTSLLPVRRGIIAGIFAQPKEGLNLNEVEVAYSAAYGEYPLVSHGTCKKHPGLLSLKKVNGTGKTHISYALENQKLYVFSCIDNLLKGAASQAIENFNRIYDLPTWTGIQDLEAIA